MCEKCAELRAEVERLEVQVESEKAQKECYQQRAESAEQQAEALAGSLAEAYEAVRKILNGNTNPPELDPQGWDSALSTYRAAQKGASE